MSLDFLINSKSLELLTNKPALWNRV